MYGLPHFFNPLKLAEIARTDPKLLDTLASETKEAGRKREQLLEKQSNAQEALKRCEEKLGGQWFLRSAARLEPDEPEFLDQDSDGDQNIDQDPDEAQGERDRSPPKFDDYKEKKKASFNDWRSTRTTPRSGASTAVDQSPSSTPLKGKLSQRLRNVENETDEEL
jgi:hypothetical protein